ncbi:MAG: hypothetical protein Q9211_006907 [Gyalolechia sp. 1 TL-2023]
MVKRIPSFAGRQTNDLVALLDAVQALNASTAKEHAKQHNVGAYNLYLLGAHLRRYDDLNYRDISNTLEACALANDGEFLALRIVQDASSTGRLREPQMTSPLKIVKGYADQGFPKAVFLWGQLMETHGKHLETLHFYHKWTEIYAQARQSPPFSKTMDATELANISKALARLRARSGDHAGAEEAVREAAQVYHDPTAYFYLAIDFTAPSSPEFETYLLKAAASGNPDAAHELGVLYFNQSRQGIPLVTLTHTQTSTHEKKPTSEADTSLRPTSPPLPPGQASEKRATAKEWFAIAASSSITASQIYLALLLRSEGRADEGLGWLQAASNSRDSGEWTEAINSLKRIWSHHDTRDLTQIDIETLRKSRRHPQSKSGAKQASLIDASLTSESYHRSGFWKRN